MSTLDLNFWVSHFMVNKIDQDGFRQFSLFLTPIRLKGKSFMHMVWVRERNRKPPFLEILERISFIKETLLMAILLILSISKTNNEYID